MKNPSQYHKAAVNSGQWLLYRHDPRKSNPFQLDSNEPTLSAIDYLKMEKRFNELFKPTNEALIKRIQDNTSLRFQKFKSFSLI